MFKRLKEFLFGKKESMVLTPLAIDINPNKARVQMRMISRLSRMLEAESRGNSDRDLKKSIKAYRNELEKMGLVLPATAQEVKKFLDSLSEDNK